MECNVEDEELNDGVAEKVEELLLLRLVPAEAREAAGNTGNVRASWSSAGSGELEPGSYFEGDDV
jgi:hypothetical protein